MVLLQWWRWWYWKMIDSRIAWCFPGKPQAVFKRAESIPIIRNDEQPRNESQTYSFLGTYLSLMRTGSAVTHRAYSGNHKTRIELYETLIGWQPSWVSPPAEESFYLHITDNKHLLSRIGDMPGSYIWSAGPPPFLPSSHPTKGPATSPLMGTEGIQDSPSFIHSFSPTHQQGLRLPGSNSFPLAALTISSLYQGFFI